MASRILESPSHENTYSIWDKSLFVKKFETSIDDVQRAVKNWKQYAKDCNVSNKNTEMIQSVLKQNINL